MTVEMKKYKLGDLIDVSRGKSLAGEFYATSGNLVRLTMGNFDYINNCFKQNTSKDNLFFSGKVEEKFILNAGDIITPLTEQTPGLLGSTARIPESGKYIQSQDVALVKCKKDKLDDGFAYYLVSSESVKKQLGAAAQQTKIRHTSPDKIKDCTVYIPEISIQKKIGNVLSTLDKRIENLRAQNRVLEQTAKTIYDYTFLQCAGHQTTYNKTLNRNIPVGWEVKKIGEFFKLYDSKRVPLSKQQREKMKGQYPYYGATGVMDFVNDYLFDGDYILLAEDGSTSDGNGHPVVQLISGKNWVNNHAHIMLPNDPTDIYFGYYTLKCIPVKKIESGSIQKKISQENLLPFQIAVPDTTTMKSFNNQVTPLFKKQLVNTKQIETLTTQRNTLLPLLMTGQVEVC